MKTSEEMMDLITNAAAEGVAHLLRGSRQGRGNAMERSIHDFIVVLGSPDGFHTI
jgi:hypothetical protein